jgi:hypothetical protein
MLLQVGLADFFLADQLTSQVCNMSELQETFTQLHLVSFEKASCNCNVLMR